jgi:putative flavoprotein involved in K+ transport
MPGEARALGERTRVQTLVIGGGQAGLAVGYHLARREFSFLIIDANERTGDSWRNRWDSLRLFTPARYNALPGMPLPGPAHSFSTKDEVADYLETYAARFDLPLRMSLKVDRLSRPGDRFVVDAGDQGFEAENVVVAMASHQVPRVPPFAAELDDGVVQLHSGEYRNPSGLQEGGVLVVGMGNSGAEIAMEVATVRPTWLAGKESGLVPFRIDNALAKFVLLPLMFRFIGHRVLTVRTPVGRKARHKHLSHGAPLVRVQPRDLVVAGIERVPRVVGVVDGLPLLADGRILEVRNVIWCTGFRPDFSWIDLPVFGDAEEPNEPIHQRGVVVEEPGLYFVGLSFLYAMSSGFLPGVGRDARHVVEDMASHDSVTGPRPRRSAGRRP